MKFVVSNTYIIHTHTQNSTKTQEDDLTGFKNEQVTKVIQSNTKTKK